MFDSTDLRSVHALAKLTHSGCNTWHSFGQLMLLIRRAGLLRLQALSVKSLVSAIIVAVADKTAQAVA